MIKAVIFDMDGVIIQSESLYQERRVRFFKEKGVSLPDNFDELMIGSNPKAMFELLFPGDLEKQARFLHDYRQFGRSQTIEYAPLLTPGIRELLTKLKEAEFPIGLASSGNYEGLITILKETQLLPFFDVVLSGEDMPASKPAPDIYLEAARRLGVSPDTCVAIEDSFYGIQAATQAGMTCLALEPLEGQIDQSQATSILSSLDDVWTWIMR